MNWDAHRYSSAVASLCWASDRSATELSWNHRDPSYIRDSQFCRGVWDGAVLPDSKELWGKCSKKHGKFYMTPDCPPPPPYHHKPLAVEFAKYYLTLARQSYLTGDGYGAGRYFGIFSHYLADVIIEPYVLARENGGVEAVWEYEQVATPINEAVLRTEPDTVVPERPSVIVYPSPYDYIAGKALVARSLVAREEYEKAVQVYWRALSSSYVFLTRGYYSDKIEDEVLAGLSLAGGVLALALGATSGNPILLSAGSVMGTAGLPFVMYVRYRMLW